MTTTTRPLLDLTVVCVGSAWRLVVAGELDTASGGLLIETAESLVTAAHPERADIDLAAVTFADTAGWRAVQTARRRITDAGGESSVVAVSPPLRRLLDCYCLQSRNATAR